MAGTRVRIGAAAIAIALVLLGLAAPAAAQPKTQPKDGPNLGPNVKIFDPSMPVSQIQATVDAIAAQQVDNEMGSQRYALLFLPGTYGTADNPLDFQVGYYTEVAGLGASPNDVVINGHIDVYNRCFAADNCSALDNFWRSLSNLTINIAGLSGCRASAEFWAVSQASPMRRVDITGGNLSLFDYCTAGPQYASGGFIADSKTGFVINGSQQQFLVRNSSIGGWSNGVWNQVFAGVNGAPAQSFPNPPYTTLLTNPISRERPYLVADPNSGYRVIVPATATDTSGTSWDADVHGREIPLSDFYIAHPGDSVQTINNQLSRGKNLLFTPGVYPVNRTIEVKRADTVVLGLGLATLTAVRGAVSLSVADVPGVDIAGLIIDAGPDPSPTLLRVGITHGPRHRSSPTDPTGIQDVFFRVGGPHAGKARTALEVNTDDVVLDDIWAWRADHGAGVGWTANTADTGVVVNGARVSATGLFVEHFQKYNVIWNGEDGRTIFFQNELPYDPPSQAAWEHDGLLGWAAYKVADDVTHHELYGGGSYIFTDVDPTIHDSHAFEVPTRPGVQLHDTLTVSLNGDGTIDNVVDNAGGPTGPGSAPTYLVSYP